ncbi:uncharacterized protein LOC109540160 isoform X1 [Dendroctonus ponderosae]|uniref:uncharacterized protein LOC109540160 isoform X1 n=1 Tax=Dendroctonus ponderosae TaxID=77166 RepID=UPI0020365D82|nr:uncharacterized protein LOC109540160 isoform X1 [Dendroctonus ponderosae]
MIIIFHYIGMIFFQILRNRKRLKSTKTDEDVEHSWTFDPPVYRQRYWKIYEILVQENLRNNVKKLVDFGCGEFSLFSYIKRLNVEEMVFVDIDEALMVRNIDRLEPFIVDRLKRRSSPLVVTALRGSAADPDYRLRKTDVVTAIEIIEHLYPDTLDALPYNVFQFVRPKLAIFTTPNADFNVVFGRMRGAMRHPDHKFEWTRQQFEDWAHNITERFVDYTVEFSGLGIGPEHLDQIGCCSQVATFTRKDVLDESYISPTYAKHCHCDKTSPCQGQAIESKLLCNCLCGLCLPDFSVGVCTYFSCNIDESEAYRPMKTDKAFSETDLNRLTLYDDRMERGSNELNPSHNIFYKLIEAIDYPYEVDLRSEAEKLMNIFSYRIQTFSNFNSRFYVEGKGRCEIPIWDIMYGDIEVTEQEVGKLLIGAGYTLEECISTQSGATEKCIISVPQEMEEISGTSEETDGYSTKSSNDTTKSEPNVAELSDWDDYSWPPPEADQGACSAINSPRDDKAVNPDPLVDSGYQKSPSPLDPHQHLPHFDPVEIDFFEDIVSTPNMHSNDNKLHLKKAVAKDKFADALDKSKLVDANKINELDRFHNMSPARAFMGSYLRPQNEFKKGPLRDLSVAGTSSGWKRPRKFKDKEKKVETKLKEPTVLDDAKSLTNCIIENTLNQVDADDEDVGGKAELIHNLSPLREAADVIDAGPLEIEPQPPLNPEAEPAAVGAVENGDLANNNRDNEGNNLEENDVIEADVDEGIDLNDNLEELAPGLEDNVPLENNNGAAAEEVVEEIAEHAEGVERENEASWQELEAEISLRQASREVLFDANSEQDLLEEFDIPSQPNQDLLSVLDLGTSVVLVGIRPIRSDDSRLQQAETAASIQTNTNIFPHWLLQILGSQIVAEENQDPPGSLDEPHFYCQGDGLGVHPSILAVDVDEAEDADNDTTTEESSSNNTVDYAEVDPGPSEMLDMSSLPEELSLATSVVEDASGTANENVPESSCSHSAADDIQAEGTSLINEILRSAVEEVSRRTLTNSTASSGVDGQNSSQVSFDGASKHSNQSHEHKAYTKQSQPGSSGSTTESEVFTSQTNSDHRHLNVIYSNSNPEVVSNGYGSHRGSVDGLKSEDESVNESDISEYFQSTSEEF